MMNDLVSVSILLAGIIVVLYVALRGWTIRSRRGSGVPRDESVLDAAAQPPLGMFMAAWVAGATLAGVGGVENAATTSPYVLLALLAIPAAIGGDLLRRISFNAIAVFGLVVGFAETTTGACGDALGFAALLISVASVLVLFGAGAYRVVRQPSLSDAGVGGVLLAAVSVLQLARGVLQPGGLAVLGETGTAGPGVQIAITALLFVVAAGCGLRPRAGASLAALGVLVLNFLLGAVDTPCGLQFMALMIVGLTYAFMVFGLWVFRQLVPSRWRS